MHKTANVLNKLPSSVQGKAKKDLHAIYQAENRDSAEKAFDRFIAKYGTKHDKAANCLVKDCAALLAFYDFPAEPLRSLLAAPISWIGSKASWPLMEARAHLESNREHLRHGAVADRQNQGMPVTRHRAGPSRACWPCLLRRSAQRPPGLCGSSSSPSRPSATGANSMAPTASGS